AAIFSLVNSLLLRTLPVAEPERLVRVSDPTAPAGGWTYAIWEQIRQRAQPFDGAAAVSLPQRFNLAQSGETQPIDGLYVSGDCFATLGVSPLVGRMFTSADEVRGGGPDGPVVVISYALWQRRFGGAAGVVGAQMVLGRTPFTIIGVAPP